MMHPFSGVTVQALPVSEEPGVTRRQVLGTMVFAVGTVAVPAVAYGQVAATDAINEAGKQPAITTLAIGEEGALTRAANEAGGRVLPAVTTEPFGEEAGRVTSRIQPGFEDGGNPGGKPPVLTQALPEEGRATTLAIGEEGARPAITTEAVNEEGGNKVPQATTNALNEEGGLKEKLPQATTLAIGEEGGAAAPVEEAPQVAVAVAAVQLIGKPVQPLPAQIQPLPEQAQPVQIQITTQALNEEAATQAALEAGVATTRALGEEAATRALNEAGINLGGVIAVPPMARDLSEAQLKTVWEDMGASDPGKALQACAVLYGSKQALTFLKENLKLELPKADAALITKLVKELDSDDFDTREKAEQTLDKLGMAATTALQAALDSKDTSMEVKMRAKRLLDKNKDLSPVVRLERGVEVLVALNTPDSKSLLETLARGNQNDLAVTAAKKALARINK